MNLDYSSIILMAKSIARFSEVTFERSPGPFEFLYNFQTSTWRIFQGPIYRSFLLAFHQMKLVLTKLTKIAVMKNIPYTRKIVMTTTLMNDCWHSGFSGTDFFLKCYWKFCSSVLRSFSDFINLDNYFFKSEMYIKLKLHLNIIMDK